jgi:hypothetical protein
MLRLERGSRLLVDHYEEDAILATTSPLPPGVAGGNEALALTIQELLFTSETRPFFTQQTRGLNAIWGSSGARAYGCSSPAVRRS